MKNKYEWHRHFAWWPVKIEPTGEALFKFVERRLYISGFDWTEWWIYRLPPEKKDNE